MTFHLDSVDKRIIMQLQENGVTSNQDLAKQIKLSPAATLARVKKLELAGVIKKYGVVFDHSQLGFDLLCFIQVSLKHHELSLVSEFREAIIAMPNVIECHFLTGMSDYLLKVAVRNTHDLEYFLVNILTPTVGVDKIKTSVVLNEVKNHNALPVLQDDH